MYRDYMYPMSRLYRGFWNKTEYLWGRSSFCRADIVKLDPDVKMREIDNTTKKYMDSISPIEDIITADSYFTIGLFDHIFSGEEKVNTFWATGEYSLATAIKHEQLILICSHKKKLSAGILLGRILKDIIKNLKTERRERD